MLSLHFGGLVSELEVALGPAPWYRVTGNFIYQGPEGEPVATYRRHQWEVGGDHYTRFHCRERARVHFEDPYGTPSEDFGPFRELAVTDGALSADGRLFAKFVEETQLWHCFPTENYWAVLVLQPADATD